MDAPEGEDDPVPAEGAVPRDRVVIVRVDERTVDVEQHSPPPSTLHAPTLPERAVVFHRARLVWAAAESGESPVFFGRGLVETQEDFEQAVKSMSVELMHYMEGATPRVQLSENVYTSTEYPANQSIELHNELSYVITWPGRIWFFCVTPSQEGGETPIADVRKVLKRIDSAIVDRFVQKGWMLVRNFGNDMSLPWQKVFRTDNPSALEAYCREAQVEFEWIDSNRLRTRQVRPPIARHPRTGETIWFNHICFWHVSSLDPGVRESMLTVFGEENLPYNTYYGDGSPIEDSVIDEIREAYRQETVKFPWRERDLLMLDNMLVAHGRQQFVGPRRILAAMGDPCSDRGL